MSNQSIIEKYKTFREFGPQRGRSGKKGNVKETTSWTGKLEVEERTI